MPASVRDTPPTHRTVREVVLDHDRQDTTPFFVHYTRYTYAPSIQPLCGFYPGSEAGWHHLKDVDLRNLLWRDLEEVHRDSTSLSGAFGRSLMD